MYKRWSKYFRGTAAINKADFASKIYIAAKEC